MESKLKELIRREDKCNPSTDQELADRLSLRREDVTQLRKKMGIPDSRERRKVQLMKDAREILSHNQEISARALAAELQQKGYQISRHIASQVLKDLSDTQAPTAEYEATAFTDLIGWDGSLRTQIQQAKAAIIYPPTGLHTLLLGESGVGKSELAEAMYRYSVEAGQRPDSSPFVVFNCADYAENSRLLISQLFGHVRGAYTGADEDKVGLVEMASGGILFLDEVHRLPPEGQEILYAIIDRGAYRRLGETETLHRVNLMIIAATTENLESTLLIPFRRRIPMVIELPPWRSRPLVEKAEIVMNFFRQEAGRVGKKLIVHRDVMKALLSGDKPGNVGQIKSDIQVACARGFLNHFSNHDQTDVEITLAELSLNTRQSLLSIRNSREVDLLLPKDGVFYPVNGDQRPQLLSDNFYALPDEIYQRIEELFQQGRKQGLSTEDASHWVSAQLEEEFSGFIRRIETIKPSLSRGDLEKIIGSQITNPVAEMVEIAVNEIDVDSEQLFFYLAIHLHTALERVKSGKPIINPQLGLVKKDHQGEYLTAVKMGAVVKRNFGIALPEDEIGFIALYLRSFLKSNTQEGRVAVLVLSHGRIAQEMVNVVSSLFKVDHAHSLDMALTESPDDFLIRVVALAREIDQGKGVLLLVDMGSLVSFGEVIEKELGTRVRVVDRVDLVMVLEATRWASLTGADLDEIADDLTNSKSTLLSPIKRSKKQIIVTVCLSGYGGAERIRDYLVQHFDNPDIEIKTLGVIDEPRFRHKLEQWQKASRVAVIVGTINPEIPGVPFIPFHSITSSQGLEYLKSLVTAWNYNKPSQSNTSIITSKLIAPRVAWSEKNIIINKLGHKLLKNGYVRDGFIQSVLEREELAPTCLEGGIAIPHADPELVLRPGLAIATLNQPIPWWGLEIDVIFLLALRISDKQIFERIMKIFRDEKMMRKIRLSESAAEIEEVINNVLKQ